MRHLTVSLCSVVTLLLSLVVALGAGQALVGARAPQSQLVFSATPLRDGIVGKPYLDNLCNPPLPGPGDFCGGVTPTQNPQGGTPPYQFRLDAMGGVPPPGLTLYPNGVIAGTPTAGGMFPPFRVCVVDKTGQVACFAVTIVVREECELVFTDVPLQDGYVNEPYPTQSICRPPIGPHDLCGGFMKTENPQGCKPPYSFQLDRLGGFPPFGLMLNLNGTITGTPTAAGPRYFTVCTHDLTGVYSCRQFSIVIHPERKKEQQKEGQTEQTAAGTPKRKGPSPQALAAIGGGAALAGVILAKQLGESLDCGNPPEVSSYCLGSGRSTSSCQQAVAAYTTWCNCMGGTFNVYTGSCSR